MFFRVLTDVSVHCHSGMTGFGEIHIKMMIGPRGSGKKR